MKLSKIVVASLALVGATPVMAEDVESIINNIELRLEGDTSRIDMTMVLEDKRGNKRRRTLRSFSKLMEGKESMSIYFLSPGDVKGSAFLSLNYEDESASDDAWLYLPALNKVRRVSQTNQSDSFMGSDFSYSDITGVEIRDWTYEIVNESAMVDGRNCWVLESVPKPENRKRLLLETGYTKRRIWVDKEKYFVLRGQYHLEKGNKVKLMQVDGVKQIDGIWTASQISMATTKNKKILSRSSILFKEVEYNLAVPDSIFSTSALSDEPVL